MSSTSADFRAPPILGILGASLPPSTWLAHVERCLKNAGLPHMCLPFAIEPRYLKNTLACMQLMDMSGLIVHGSHRRSIVRFMHHLDPLARRSGIIDVILKRKKKWYGMALMGSTLQAHLKKMGVILRTTKVTTFGKSLEFSFGMTRSALQRHPPRQRHVGSHADTHLVFVGAFPLTKHKKFERMLASLAPRTVVVDLRPDITHRPILPKTIRYLSFSTLARAMAHNMAQLLTNIPSG